MPTRVTPYLGGTGQDNTRKLNVHSSLNRVSIGADVLASANLDVFGNTFVRGNVETANTFVSTSNSNTPLQAFVGESAGGRWLNKGGSSAFAWYSDTLVTPVTGFSSITYYGTTFYPKIVFGSLGDISVAGKFATNAAQINRDGTASFGSLTVPSLNTVGITGNVYISGNLFVAGNSYQITSNITQAVGNVVTANAYVVTRLLGVTDIPMSNGITFSNANLVISAYANPSIVFSANNNVWVGANTAIIGRVASVWTYNPYQLVDDGLVVQHNGGRGNIIQTWIDGRVGTTTRPWSLALTTQGDMAWLVGTAANVKPTIQRMMIDQNGNTLFGTGTVNRANVTITGNASVSTNLTVAANAIIGSPTNYSAIGLSENLTLVPPGNITVPMIPLAIVAGQQTNGSQRVWGFGVNQNQQGGLNLMVSTANNVRANVNVMDFSRIDYSVTANANLNVQGNLVVLGNTFVSGELASYNFSRANALNEAAVQAACVARGWPMPAVGLIALPDIDPPGNMIFSRTTTAYRFNKNKLLDVVPIGKVRHEYDVETGEYLGWNFSGTAAKSNPFLWSNNLAISQHLTVSGVSGTFIEGEYVTANGNTGVYYTGSATIYGIAGTTANLSGTLTGNTSGATATITASSNIWIADNMIVASNAVGLDGQANHATYLEATAANATVEQSISVSNAIRTGVLYLKRLVGTGNINVSFNGTTWLPITNKRYQDTFVLSSNNFTDCRFSGASGVNPSVKIRLETAGDKIVVGNMYVSNTDISFNPIINGPTGPSSMGAETLRFDIDALVPRQDFTFYVKAYVQLTNVNSYIATLSNNTSTANMVNFFQSGSVLFMRMHTNTATNVAVTHTYRTMGSEPQDITIVGRYKDGNLVMYGNDRLQVFNVGNNIATTSTVFDRLTLGKRGDLSTTQAGNYIFKEVMIWPTGLDDATLRLIGNGSKNSIPRPFIENAAQMRPVLQALTKLKTGGTSNVSIECAGDSYGAGTSGTASWPLYLAKYLDTQYSNSLAAVGWVPGGTNLGPARSDLMTVSFPVGSWTQTLRTKVSPNLGTSTTSSAGGYMSFVFTRALGTGAAVKLLYLTTADGQAEYSWNSGATRYPLDLTVGTVGNIGTYNLANIISVTGELRIYRVSGTIEIAGVNFTNTNPSIVVHKMANASGLAKDWYTVDSTQWKIGYETINPTASIIMLGANDQAAVYNEESFAFYLQDMINRRRATVTNRPIMIVMPPDNRRANASPMDFYSREARRIAALNNCTFVDLQWVFGNSVAEYDLSWWSDTIIPNATEGGPALVSGIIRALESAGT